MNTDPKLVNIAIRVFMSQFSIWYQFSKMIEYIHRKKLLHSQRLINIFIYHDIVYANTTPVVWLYSSWFSSSLVVCIFLVVGKMFGSDLNTDSIVDSVSLSSGMYVNLKFDYYGEYFVCLYYITTSKYIIVVLIFKISTARPYTT